MSLISIGEVVDCLNIQSIVVLPPATGGTYDTRGKWVSGADVPAVPAQANVQPATGRILQLVPEGERTTEHVSVWLTGPFIDTTDENNATRAYKIAYRGVEWKCVAVPEDWRENGYQECLFQNTKKVYTP